MTAPPVPLIAGTGLELFSHDVFDFPAGVLGWDDPHLLQQGDGGYHGDHLLGQQPPGGGERVHAAPRAVCVHCIIKGTVP